MLSPPVGLQENSKLILGSDQTMWWVVLNYLGCKAHLREERRQGVPEIHTLISTHPRLRLAFTFK